VLLFGQKKALELGSVIGGEVIVELTPEGPQRADIAEVVELLAAGVKERRRS